MDRRNIEELFEFLREKQQIAVGDPSFDAVFCLRLCETVRAEAASVWKISGNRRLILQYGTNVSPGHVGDFSLRFGEGITGAAALTRKTIKVSDAWSEQRHNRQVDQIINFRTRSMISAPIMYNGVLYGVINILNHENEEDFPPECEDLLSLIAVLYAMALSAGKKLSDQRKICWEESEFNPKETIIVGVSRAIQDVLDLSMKAGRSRVPVLIYGETGTGKELAARKIHENTQYCDGPFLSINCAAIPETILESELFGHVKGAFSGAISNRQGKFVAASRGTLFLDEISEMSGSCQAKILRALQEKTVVPLGSEKEVEFNARIIAATNKQLDQLIRDGKFRKDLYYRLCGLEIHMPRLCERQSDIPLLIDHFIDKAFAGELLGEKRQPLLPKLSRGASDILMAYSWPGNVRQLEQAVMAALAVCDGETITALDLPVWLRRSSGDLEDRTDSVTAENKEGVWVRERLKYTRALEKTRYPGTGRWNISAAAKCLEIPRKTFVYRIKKMEISKEFLG